MHNKVFANQRIQIHPACHDIAPRDAGRFAAHAKLLANCVKHFCREERDLAFVVFLEAEEAVAGQTFARDALDFADFNRGMLGRRLLMPAKKTMPRRNEDSLDADLGRRGHG